MKTIQFYATHKETKEAVAVIKVKRDIGVRYIVFWPANPEPTIYTASEFCEKFITG